LQHSSQYKGRRTTRRRGSAGLEPFPAVMTQRVSMSLMGRLALSNNVKGVAGGWEDVDLHAVVFLSFDG